MTPLPPETVHLPFESGPYRMAMGLIATAERDWFEIDCRYPDELRQRHVLLAERHGDVFAALPGSEAACAEALALIAEHLTRWHPSWYRYEGPRLRNNLTDELWDLAHPALHPLECAGRLVQEDLCIIAPTPEGPRFTAAVLCFPTRWRLHDKLGKPLGAVHGPVPLFADRLARPVDRFMAHVKPGHIAQRVNWSVLDDPALFQTGGHWRSGVNPAITAENAGDTLYLRTERQTLRRLPHSGAVLFGIRVHVYPLGQVIATPAVAARLAEAVRALPEEMTSYKSLVAFRTALLDWLDGRSRDTGAAGARGG